MVVMYIVFRTAFVLLAAFLMNIWIFLMLCGGALSFSKLSFSFFFPPHHSYLVFTTAQDGKDS